MKMRGEGEIPHRAGVVKTILMCLIKLYCVFECRAAIAALLSIGFMDYLLPFDTVT